MTDLGNALGSSFKCSPENLIMLNIAGAFAVENFPKIEQEKAYLSSLVCLLKLYGDPRGRGNFATPISLLLSWKLSILPMVQDRKIHDSEYAEELYDASLLSLYNHRKHFREHQAHL